MQHFLALELFYIKFHARQINWLLLNHFYFRYNIIYKIPATA